MAAQSSMDLYPFATDGTWYLATARGEKPHEHLVSLCREIEIRQKTLLTNTKQCMAVFQYGGDARDSEPHDHTAINETDNVFNAAQNGVETVFSKVIKDRIDAMPLTNGGGYLARHRAKQMGKALEGIFEENDLETVEEDVVMDALTTDHGAGACKVFEEHGRVKIEHVPIEDVWYDPAEIRQRKPRCCYHVPEDGMDVFVALEKYAKAGDDYPGFVGSVEERRSGILKAAANPETWRTVKSQASKLRVDIFEAWHLPSGDCGEEEEYEDEQTGEKKKRVKHDGRHVVAVAGCTIIDEPWEEDWFPILMYVPRPRRRSIWGLSLMRDWIAPQREYEKLTKKIQNQHQKMGVSGWTCGREGNFNVREITAGTMAAGWVAETDGGVAPQPVVPEPVAQGTYAYAESIPRNMLERKGISTLAAASQLPAGLQQASGKALQVFEDFEDVRLRPYYTGRRKWKIALSWLVVNTACRIVDRGDDYTTYYNGKQGRELLHWAEWKEMLQDRKSFSIRVFPVSALSKHPAAKFAQLVEMLNAGAITVEQFKRLYEIPDLEAENELDSADTDVIDRNLDVMITTGRYIGPQPFDDLELIKVRTGKFINMLRARVDNDVPESRMKLLRDLLEDVQFLQEDAAAKAAAANTNGGPPGGGGTPMVDPAAQQGMAPPEGPLPGMEGALPMPAAA